MKNMYIPRLMEADLEKFTSNTGIRIRKLIGPAIRGLMKLVVQMDNKIYVHGYPKLEKGRPYIFASTHSFPDDITSALVSMDRHAYFLTNSKDALLYNKQMYAAWLNGFIFVDTRNKASRKASLSKMLRILNSNTSILIYPEGSWNVTENKTVKRLFPGTCIMAQKSGCSIVPVGSYLANHSKSIHMHFGEPLDLAKLSVEEGTLLLRDSLATLRYGLIEQHGPVTTRETLPRDARFHWLLERKREVLAMPWKNPDWEDEYLSFFPRELAHPEEAWAFLEDLDITKPQTAFLTNQKRAWWVEKRYDLVEHLNQNWQSDKANF